MRKKHEVLEGLSAGEPTDDFSGDTYNYGYRNDAPGSWVMGVTPEPLTSLLLGTGLLAILGAARRKLFG